MRPACQKTKSLAAQCPVAGGPVRREENHRAMKTTLMLSACLLALPVAVWAQPTENQGERPPRVEARRGGGDEFRGPAGPAGRGFRGEFGSGPRGRQAGPEMELRQGPRRCPNCGWCPEDGVARGQGLGPEARRLRRGAGGPPEWGPRPGAGSEGPGFGPRARQNEDGPPFRRGAPGRNRPESDNDDVD